MIRTNIPCPHTIELLTEVLSFQKNNIANTVCKCGEIENTSHFILHCNLYGQLRHALLNKNWTYCQLTVNVFLYHGNTDPTYVENAELFSAVQDNILKTKRFC